MVIDAPKHHYVLITPKGAAVHLYKSLACLAADRATHGWRISEETLYQARGRQQWPFRRDGYRLDQVPLRIEVPDPLRKAHRIPA